jgi:hypothetical protein
MVEQSEEEANLRLQAIASLPNLGVFSDEAHHTYGREIGAQLKRVRQTVDYLHEKTDLVCVVNTTGTPYYERQPLRDVVIWYGLSEGIRDNILKAVDGSIYAYDFDQQHAGQFVARCCAISSALMATFVCPAARRPAWRCTFPRPKTCASYVRW